jgi:NADPH:quinone reductase-like Zn-dependent oxidoreductase
VRDVRKPAPGEGGVLVQVAYASVNAADVRSMRMGIVRKGQVMGADIAGCVTAVGKNAGKFRPGDEVLGEISGASFGGFAEFAVAPEDALILARRDLV